MPALMSVSNNPEPDVRAIRPNQALSIKRRQVGRIIRHLRDELSKRQGGFCLPTGNIIEALLFNCPDDIFEHHNWHKLVVESLNYLHRQTDSRYFSSQEFIQPKTEKPLFPSPELFDELDCHHFCKTLLDYLEEDTCFG